MEKLIWAGLFSSQKFPFEAGSPANVWNTYFVKFDIGRIRQS